MQRSKCMAINTIVGLIVGEIFLIPFLAWPTGGHGFVDFPWTKPFMAAGALWGCLCGVAIPSIEATERARANSRILSAAMVGGGSGLAFYLIGDLAFRTSDGLTSVFWKSLWGLGIGTFDAMFCILLLWLIRYGRGTNLENQASDPHSSEPHRLTSRILSSAIGMGGGTVFGAALLTLCGQLILYHYWGLALWQLWLFAPLIVLLGIAGGIYAFIKPIAQSIVDKSMHGLSNGVTFSVLSVFYLVILRNAILMTNVPKPEFMKDEFFVNSVMDRVFAFTFLFGWISGTIGGLVEGLLMRWRMDKHSLPSDSLEEINRHA